MIKVKKYNFGGGNVLKIFKLLVGLSAFSILLCGYTTNINKNINIEILPSLEVNQGETLVINIKSDTPLTNPIYFFKGKKYKIYKKGKNSYKALLGISAIEKTGVHYLLIRDKDSKLEKQFNLTVAKSNFPIQNIRISGKKSSLSADNKELKLIANAKKVISNIAYWNDIPFNSPTKGCLASKYGLLRYHNGKPTGNYHKGIDIKAPSGQIINTITKGQVILAQRFRLHGNTVVIDHGQGLVSLYIHMKKIYVKQGDIVTADQEIGEVGTTGFSTGPHLHFGLYINGTPINPVKYWLKYIPKCK